MPEPVTQQQMIEKNWETFKVTYPRVAEALKRYDEAYYQNPKSPETKKALSDLLRVTYEDITRPGQKKLEELKSAEATCGKDVAKVSPATRMYEKIEKVATSIPLISGISMDDRATASLTMDILKTPAAEAAPVPQMQQTPVQAPLELSLNILTGNTGAAVINNIYARKSDPERQLPGFAIEEGKLRVTNKDLALQTLKDVGLDGALRGDEIINQIKKAPTDQPVYITGV